MDWLTKESSYHWIVRADAGDWNGLVELVPTVRVADTGLTGRLDRLCQSELVERIDRESSVDLTG